MQQSRKTYSITSDQQLQTLVSAARQEIVDVLAQMGTVSVAELAAALGRPADALYYHLRILKKAGLIQEVIDRKEGGSTEARFRTLGQDLRIDYDAARKKDSGRLSNVVSSMLRLGIRDFKEAAGNPEVAVSGAQRELWASRKTGWLERKDLQRLIEHLDALTSSMPADPTDGELYGVTILVTPLNRRRPRNSSKALKRKGSK